MINLNSMRIRNYKSIVDSGTISVGSKFTVLAGKNNAGKTAFIEALSKVFFHSYHNDYSSILDQGFKLDMRINLQNSQSVIHKIFGQTSTGDLLISFYIERGLLLFSIEDIISGSKCTPILQVGNDMNLKVENCKNASTHMGHSSYDLFFTELSQYFIFISGSRNTPGLEVISDSEVLSNNASNLNSHLLFLHNNSEKIFDLIATDFSKVFPDVSGLKTIFFNNQTRIELQFKDLDYAIPLSECGSGYTQTLILLSVLHSEENKVVFYDEPQTFLHPSAEKAIYDLSSLHPMHQFVFTTHSSILINYPVEKQLFLVKKENRQSTYTSLNKYKDVLNEIGLFNSDFSFADKIIFVEGETEELILPILLKEFGMRQLGYNYIILNMKGTGKDFTKRGAMNNNAAKLKLIMEGLSKEAPIPYLIVIDKDERNEEQISALHDAYGEHIYILERREIENYFLDCYDEICSVINGIKPELQINNEIIEEHLNVIMQNNADRTLYPKTSELPLRDVKGSKVLEFLFEKYELVYSKVYHGEIIATQILKNSPKKLKPIADQISLFLSK